MVVTIKRTASVRHRLLPGYYYYANLDTMAILFPDGTVQFHSRAMDKWIVSAASTPGNMKKTRKQMRASEQFEYIGAL